MMESFSADFLGAIKRYWVEFHLELFILLCLIPERKGSISSAAFMDSYMTISHTRLVCLPSRWVSPGCSIKGYWTESHMEFCQISTTDPANIRLHENVLKTSLRRLSSSSSEDVVKTSWSSEYIHITQDVFKTYSRRLDQDQYNRLGHTSSRRLAKMSSRPVKDVSLS